MMLLIKANGQFQVMVDQPYSKGETIKVYDFEPVRLSDDGGLTNPQDPLFKARIFRWALSYGDWSIWLEN
jgi:hypothetical protein